MSARPIQKLKTAIIHAFTGKNAAAFIEGVGVKFTATEGEVDVCAAGENPIGVALETKTGDGTSKIQVVLLAGGGVVKVKLSSGGCTQGDYLKCGTGGFETQALGGGTTVRYLVGRAIQTGVSGDFIGMIPVGFSAGSA